MKVSYGVKHGGNKQETTLLQWKLLSHMANICACYEVTSRMLFNNQSLIVFDWFTKLILIISMEVAVW